MFSWLISRFYYWIRRNLPFGRHFGYCFHSRPCFLIDISSRTIYRNFEMLFSCLSNFLFLFQECSVVNTLGSIACLGLFPPGGMVSTTRRRFGKTMVEVVHPGELLIYLKFTRTILASGQVVVRLQQSVAKMMTSFAFSCLCHHRGVSGYAGTPSFRQSKLTRNTGS